VQHSTLFLALKEAFLELSAAQPGFFRYPGRGLGVKWWKQRVGVRMLRVG